MKNIATALVKAQKAFAPALKTSTNPHFKSKYADLSACVEAVIDALNANGIALIQRTYEDQSGVTVETVFIHESGEILESGKLHVPASKQDPQGYGSALTYARRYSLMAASGIAPEDDDGNAASKPRAKVTPTAGAGETLTAGERRVIEQDAEGFQVHFNAGMDIAKIIEAMEEQQYETEQKVYCWSLLDSKLRSAIMKHKSEQKNKKSKDAEMVDDFMRNRQSINELLGNDFSAQA